MSDYTPDEGEISAAYVRDMASVIVRDGVLTDENVKSSDSEACRGLAKIKADALREAANELEDRESCYNDAMSAAFVAGETGRGDVISAYESILEEPYSWLRERADRIEEE